MKTLTGFMYYPDSLVEADGVTYFLARSEESSARLLGAIGDARSFEQGQGIAADSGSTTHLYPLTAENAAALRQRLPWLRPQPLGLRATAGFGDRLGVATPGHIRALEEVLGESAESPRAAIAPIFAQQSVRENARTHRTPQQVLDDAMWGAFQCGWRGPWGADADHLKNPADIDAFHAAGFTFFTIDPGDYVDNAAQEDTLPVLRQKASTLPWDVLQSTLEETVHRYLGQTAQVEDFAISFEETSLLRALAKYGRALSHTRMMAEHLNHRSGGAHDLEISVDETATPTSIEEHFFIASELHRMGLHWVSLAPRFVGSFYKGVDYIGDLAVFEKEFAAHAAIARYFGKNGSGYRLSLHSGSDKFSIYPIAARHTNGLVHLKTAGTSYLAALRVAALNDHALFRAILHLALERFEEDRASYHVAADPGKLPDLASIGDHDLAGLLDQFDVRQILHVTFGAALEQYGSRLLQMIGANENNYYEALTRHFQRHLEPFAVVLRGGEESGLQPG